MATTGVGETIPLIRTYMYNHRKITFERATNVCEKQCLGVRLTFMILENAFERATDVCVKQCL